MKAPQRFYVPEGEPSEGGSNAPTTLTYNYGGEEISVDLSNPESVKLAQDRLSKGHNMEKIAEERNKLKEEAEKYKQQLDGWNNRLEAAKTDPEEFKALIKDLEEYTGKPLTQQEKQDLADPELESDDPVARKLAQMEQTFKTYQETQERKEQLREKQVQEDQSKEYAKQLVADLDRMEKDKDNFPGFDRDAVYNEAVKNSTTNFEMVYYFLNRDAATKAQRDKIEAEYKELTDKRKAAGTETDTTPADLTDKPKKFGKLEDVTKSVLSELKEKNISLFTD